MGGDLEAIAAIGKLREIPGDPLQSAIEQRDAELERRGPRDQHRVDDDEAQERPREEARADPCEQWQRPADAHEGDAHGGDEGDASQGRDRRRATLEEMQRPPQLGEAFGVVDRGGLFGRQDPGS